MNYESTRSKVGAPRSWGAEVVLSPGAGKAPAENGGPESPPDYSKIRKLALTDGTQALIDANDYERCRQHTWTTCGGYVRHVNSGKSLHNFLLGPGSRSGKQVDHKNRNKKDCRRSNLRWATPTLNRANNPPRLSDRKGSAFKGVRRIKTRWMASIRSGGIRYRLGVFSTEVDAARAYDRKARELFGEFAWLNFPTPTMSVDWSIIPDDPFPQPMGRCVLCGKTYPKHRSDQRFCRPACAVCFRQHLLHPKMPFRWGSNYRPLSSRPHKIHKPKKPMTVVHCQTCLLPFQQTTSARQTTCSNYCRERWYNYGLRTMTYKANLNPKQA